MSISDGQIFKDYTYVDGRVNDVIPTSNAVKKDG